MDKLPHRYTVVRNGKKNIYKTKEEYLDAKKSGDVQYTSQGIDIDIVLEIKVPAQCKTAINAIYGIVEVANFNAPLKVDDIYGGIDATVNTARIGRLQATTQYGGMYSNLDLKLTEHTQRAFLIRSPLSRGPDLPIADLCLWKDLFEKTLRLLMQVSVNEYF